MCQNWRLIELTNGNIGAVPAGSLLPIGAITRKVARRRSKSERHKTMLSPFPNTESITSNTQELSLPEQLEF